MPIAADGLTFTRAHDWTDDKAANIRMLASRHDTHDDDIATALNAILTSIGGTNTGSVTKVSTRTTLKTLSGTTAPSVYLSESGREGSFDWDGSDLSTQVAADPNEGWFIAPDSASDGSEGAWVRVDKTVAWVEQFGAAGDGATDDTAEIQAAIDLMSALKGIANETYGRVGLQGSNYLISSWIQVPSFVGFLGVSKEATTLTVDVANWDGSRAVIVDVPNAANLGCRYISLGGFTVDMDGATTIEYGVWLQATYRSRIDNIKVTGQDHATGKAFEFGGWNQYGNTEYAVSSIDTTTDEITIGVSNMASFSHGERFRVVADTTLPGGSNAGDDLDGGEKASVYYYAAYIDGGSMLAAVFSSSRAAVTVTNATNSFAVNPASLREDIADGMQCRIGAQDTLPAGLTQDGTFDNDVTEDAASQIYYMTNTNTSTGYFELSSTRALAIAGTRDISITDDGGTGGDGTNITVQAYADFTSAGSGDVHLRRYLFRVTNRNDIWALEADDAYIGVHFARGLDSQNTYGASYSNAQRWLISGYPSGGKGVYVEYGENNTFLVCSCSTNQNNTIAWHIADAATALFNCHGDSSYSEGDNRPVPNDSEWGFPEGINKNSNVAFYYEDTSGRSVVVGFGGNGCQKRFDFVDQVAFENVNIHGDSYNWIGSQRIHDLTVEGALTLSEMLTLADLTVTGDFESVGISDSAATTTILDLTSDTQLNTGKSGADFNIVRSVNDRFFGFSGGSASGNGGNAILYGGAHAQADKILLRQGSVTRMEIGNTAGAANTSDIIFYDQAGTTPILRLDSTGGAILQNRSTPANGEAMHVDGGVYLNTSTETVQIMDAGSTSATEQDWIEVEVGGVTGYIRVFATK